MLREHSLVFLHLKSSMSWELLKACNCNSYFSKVQTHKENKHTRNVLYVLQKVHVSIQL